MRNPDTQRRVVTAVVLAAALVVGLVSALSSREGASPATADKPALEVTSDEDEDQTDRALFQASARTEDVGDPTIVPEGLTLPAASKDWTVMVYMVGSNLESRFGNATADLAEMRASGVDFSRTNVIAYAGGTRRWQSDLPADRNSVLDLSRAEDEQVVASTAAKADMGAPEALAAFVSYATRQYPAEHYALILWDHGAGPLWGSCADENYKNDTLLLSEMRRAMDETQFASSDKLDLVGFDACLMGSVEVASTWSAYADYLVASEELEPGDGWDWSALAALNGSDDPREVASAVVDAYGAYYEAAATEFSDPDATLAAYDLSQVGDVTDALGDLADVLDASLDGGGYATLAQARGDSRALGLATAGSRGEGYDLIDLASLCAGLAGEGHSEAGDLARAIDGLVASSTSNVEGLGGLSVYFPGDNAELYRASGEEVLGAVAASEAYRSFCNDYAADWLGDSTADWSLGEVADTGDSYELRLTDEQLENLSGAYYTVLMQTDDYGAYRPLLQNVRVRPDEDGVVRIPKDPGIICAVTDEVSEPQDWQFVQVDSTSDGATYRSLNTYLGTGDEFTTTGIGSSSSADATIAVAAAEGESELQIQNVSAASGALGLSGKQTLDVSGYDCVGIRYGNPLMPATGIAGETLPWSQWAEDDSTWWSNVPLGGSFRFDLVPVSTLNASGGDSFSCQLVLSDVNGGEHATGLLDLAQGERDEATVSTDKGTLRFALEGDHAELLGYEGEDTTLVVPAEVEGLPVTMVEELLDYTDTTVRQVTLPDSVKTIGSYVCGSYGNNALESVDFGEGLEEIGHGAFAGCSALAQADLPGTVTSIGGAAFCKTTLTSVHIPSSLQHLGKGAFSGIQTLTNFEQEGENGVTSVRDGVLFSADGSALLAFPAGREGSYDVPSGTVRVAYGAFAGTLLETVGLSEGLTTIDNCAFVGCHFLTSVDLPESLQTIGAWAFYSGLGASFIDPIIDIDSSYEYPEITSLRIGPNVTHVGGGAFEGLKVDAFEVDPANATYSSPGGFLCNKAGDSIVAVPEGRRGVVEVPDGVTTLGYATFTYLASDDYYGTETDIVLPDSLYRIDERAFTGYTSLSDGTTWPFLLHASEGSAAEAYAERYGLPFDNVTDPDGLSHYDQTVEASDATMTFRVYPTRATLTGLQYTGSGDEGVRLEVPAEVDGVPVTQIGLGNSYQLSFNKIDTLVIPASVTSISGYSLMGSGDIELAEGNTAFKMADGALFTSDGTTLVRYAGDVESYEVPEGTETVGPYAFHGNTTLTSVVLPESVKTVSSHAFDGCSSLAEVTFSEGLEEIGNNAFYSCPVKRLDFPESLRTIGQQAFFGNSGFDSLGLPDGLETVGREAFGDSSSTGDLKSMPSDELTIGSKLSIDGSDFYSQLPFVGMDVKAFSVSEDNESLSADGPLLLSRDGKVLYECASGYVGCVVVPDGVETIEYGAFSNCQRVTDVVLPKSVSYLSSDVFDTEYDAGSSERHYNLTLHVPEGSVAERLAIAQGMPYDNETDASKFETRDVKAIVSGTELDFVVYPAHAILISATNVDGETPQASLAIPSEVEGAPLTQVGMGGFPVGLPDEVASLDIPGTVTTIDDNAFDGREHLTSLTLHEGLRSVGEKAFHNTSLSTLSLPEGLETIGDYAFWNAYGTYTDLTDLVLPESLVKVGAEALSPSSEGYYDLELPSGLTSLGQDALGGTTSAASGVGRIAVGAELTTMGAMGSWDSSYSNPFGGLRFSSYAVDEGNTSFSADGPLLLSKDGKTLYGCAPGYAGTLVVPDGVETIGGNAFDHTDFLTDVVIPASVTTVEYLTLPGEWDSDAGKSVPYATLHVEAGSAAEEYAIEHDLPYDNDMDAPQTECVDVTASGVRMSFLVVGGEATLYQCAGTADGQESTLSAPDTVDGAPVTKVGLHGQRVGLPGFVTSFELPDSLETIGRSAFFGCDSLDELTIPASVQTIDEYPFGEAGVLAQRDQPLQLHVTAGSAAEEWARNHAEWCEESGEENLLPYDVS